MSEKRCLKGCLSGKKRVFPMIYCKLYNLERHSAVFDNIRGFQIRIFIKNITLIVVLAVKRGDLPCYAADRIILKDHSAVFPGFCLKIDFDSVKMTQ